MTAMLAPVAGMQFSSISTDDDTVASVTATATKESQQVAVTIDADGTATGPEKKDGGKELKKLKKPRAKRLCDPRIVKRVCSEAFEGGDDKHAEWDQIASAVSASKDTVAKLRTTLELEVNPVKCQKLCKALVTNLRSAGATVPKRSDEACVCKEGKATCGVDVGERKIRGSVHNLKEKHHGGLTDDVTDDNEEVQVQDQDIISIDIISDGDCPDGSCISYKQEELVASLARLFHIFPNFECGTKMSLLQGPLIQGVSSEPSGWSRKIEDAKAQAQAWTDFARGQLNANTGAEERARWFGGSGTKSNSVVKTRIKESLNWISSKISGANYVYVPDNYNGGSGTKCQGSSTSGVLAFVLSYSVPNRAQGDFRAASYKQCGSNIAQSQWLAQSCVLDASGNLIVFMCQKWANFAEDSRTSTIVHELIHHTGPSDVAGYDSAQIQAASQANQLENAENYAEMVADIVDGDCVDTNGWIIDSQNWNCASFARYSNLCSSYGGSTETSMKGGDGTNANAACCVCGGGTRSGPSYSSGDPVPTPSPTPSPSPTPTPTPTRRRRAPEPTRRRRAPAPTRRRAPPSSSASYPCGTTEPYFCSRYSSYCGNVQASLTYTIRSSSGRVTCRQQATITRWCPQTCGTLLQQSEVLFLEEAVH